MKPRKFLILFSAWLGGLILSCSGPKEALTAYLDASIKGNHITAYKYISSSDKQYKDVKKYLADSSAERNNLIRALSDEVKYEIKKIEKNGDQAVALVEITTPDYAQIIQELFQGDPAKIRETPEDRIKKWVQQKYQNQIPRTTVEWNYSLVKEADGWKVYLGWEEETKSADLLQEARRLEKEKNLYGAREKYQEVLNLDPGNSKARAGLESLERKIKEYEEGQAYLGNLVISKVRVMDTVAGGLGVFMELKNNGDRTVRSVEITIEYLDRANQVLGQEVFQPVDYQKGVQTPDNAPLSPGAVKKFGVVPKNAPAGWAKKVKVRVTDVRFLE